MNKQLIRRLMSVVLVLGILLAYWGIIGLYVSPGIQSFGAKKDFSEFADGDINREELVKALSLQEIKEEEFAAVMDKLEGNGYIDELIKIIPEYNEEHARLKGEVAVVSEKLLPFDEKVKELGAQKTDLQKRIRKMENTPDSNPDELADLKVQLEALSTESANIDAQKAVINDEIKAKQKAVEAHEATIAKPSGYAELVVSRAVGYATFSDHMDYIAIKNFVVLLVLGLLAIVGSAVSRWTMKEKKESSLPDEFVNYTASRQKLQLGGKKFDLQKMLAPVALVILFAFFCLASESFRTPYTMKTILENSYYIGFLAFGVTFVIMTGGIDLSIGTSMICSALIGCYFYSSLGLPLWIAVWLVPLIAMLFGLLNGVMIAKLKLPPFIATLGTQMITTGFGQIVTKVTTQYYPTTGSANTWFKTVTYRAGTFPIGVCYLIVAFIIAFFMLNRTKFGRYTLAIGSNEEAARLSGVNTDNWKIAVYAVCGLFVGFAGVMYAAVNTVIIPGYGAGQELNGIAAVVIGGTSMSGGSGSIVGTIIGVFIMSVLKSGLSSVGLQSHWQTFFTGFVVIGAVLLDQLRTASAQKVKTEKKRAVKAPK